jgi:outer membrane receptor protein involved in Fe transport
VNLGPYQLEATYNQTGGFPYGNLGGFSASNFITNPFIEPEFVNSKEIGVELSFMRNRINLDATYFHQNNTNQILQVQQSAATDILIPDQYSRFQQLWLGTSTLTDAAGEDWRRQFNLV